LSIDAQQCITSPLFRWRYTVTLDGSNDHVDIVTLHDMLSRSYWAKDRSRKDVEKSVENSLCFSLLKGDITGSVTIDGAA